jgi:endonuclease G
MTRARRLLWLGLFCCGPALAQDFHVVASRRAVVREQPNTAATPVTRLDRGDRAACFTDPQTGQPEQQNGLYHVHLPDGRTGWVSRYTVRMRPGGLPQPIPGPAETAVEAFAREFHVAIGAPQGYVELLNEGYIVGYDPRLKIPAWVQYRVTAAQIATDRPRSNDFQVDERVSPPGRATLTDYEMAASWELWTALGLQPPVSNPNQPTYARGHLAPARDLARTDAIERSSYRLSNMAPQVHSGFNSGTWSGLERRVRGWVEARGDLTVIAGPVLLTTERLVTPLNTEAERLAVAHAEDPPTAEGVVAAQPPTERQVIYNIVGQSGVAVPTAFFKVVVDHSNANEPEVLAFLIPHYRETGRDLEDLLVSVDEIERLTGLNLLSGLPNAVQDRVEAEPAAGLW